MDFIESMLGIVMFLMALSCLLRGVHWLGEIWNSVYGM